MKSLLPVTSLILTLVAVFTPTVFAAKFNWSYPLTIPVQTETLMSLTIDTQGETITGADAVINFNPGIISVTKLEPAPSQPFANFTARIDSTTGKAYVKATHSQLARSSSGIIHLADLTIAGKNPGKSDLSLACIQGYSSDSNLTGKDSGQDILNCNLLENTYVQVEAVAVNLLENIDVQAKFAGVNQDVGPIPALIKIGSRNNPNPHAEINAVFTSLEGAIYITSIPLKQYNLSQASDFWLTIKGEKHLQRAFTNLDFSAPLITFDATSRPLQPGDLSNQDGKLDNHDINKILSILSQATTTTHDLNTTDVNYDGVVNSIDLSLILASLATKPDEPTP